MKNMIKIFALVVFLACCFTDCGKKGGTNPPAPTEENLVIALNPDPGTTVVKSLGTTYDFQVVIQSKMPAQGVEITVVYRKDSDNSIIFSQTYQVTTSPLNVTITNVPQNEIGTVTVTVTSKSKPTNTASKTFKLTRK